MINPRIYLSRKLINLAQVIEEPKIINAKLKGIVPSYVRDLFTIKKITQITPKTFVDVGAHFGETSIAMNYVFPDAKIYSFEPVPSSYKILKQKTENIKNIRLYDFALGNKEGKFDFWLNNLSAASSLLDAESQREKLFETTKRKEKITISLKKFMDLTEIKIQRPFYLKIDVEGAEKMVLEGFGNLIKNVDILQLEYNFKKLYKNQTELKDIMKYVNIAKLESFIQLGNHISEKEGIIYCDLIFFRRKK